MSAIRRATLVLAFLAVAVATGGAQTPIQVRILSDSLGYRFEPATIHVPVGGSVRFVVVNSGPHAIAFEDTLPAAVAERLNANMPSALSRLTSPFLMSAGESYTISFAGLPAGSYAFHCMAHFAMDEKGVIVVGNPDAAAAQADQASPAPVPAGSVTPEMARIFEVQMKSDLRNLVTAEEIYFTDSVRYTQNLGKLFVPTPGVGIPKISATANAWSATVTHPRLPGRICGIAVGMVNPILASASDGEPVCK